jgi:hypothetical protein
MSNWNVKNKLLEGESIIKEWATKEWSGIYATDLRIFLMNDSFFNKRLIEIFYPNISSIESGKIRPKYRLYLALFSILAFNITLYVLRSDIFPILEHFSFFAIFIRTINILSLLTTLGLVIWFLIGRDVFIINVEGRKPVYVSRELPELYKIARK